jgi:hypothetical protein
MKRVVAMGLLLAGAGFLTGCGGAGSPNAIAVDTTSAAVATSAVVATSQAPAPAPQVTDQEGVTCVSFDSAGFCPGDDPMTCDTVLDPTGWSNGPLTEVRAIGIAAAVADTDFTGIVEGTLSNTELHLLDFVAFEIKGSGVNTSDQLGQDSQQFASDESSFNPGGTDFGPEDTAYSEPMSKDIIVLVKDCPHAYKLGQQMANG